jgi:two-component system NarL family sensor kinase
LNEGAPLERLLLAEQDERRRLGELLHDGPVQHLSAIGQMLDAAAAAAADGDAASVETIVARARDVTREALADLREIVTGIEPALLADLGLAAAIRALAEQVGRRRGVVVDVALDDGVALGAAAQSGLYQIVREALDQAVRRGPPTQVTITLGAEAVGGVFLEIADDGARERRQEVIDGLVERADTLGATMTVSRRDETGTILRIVVPASSAAR